MSKFIKDDICIFKGTSHVDTLITPKDGTKVVIASVTASGYILKQKDAFVFEDELELIFRPIKTGRYSFPPVVESPDLLLEGVGHDGIKDDAGKPMVSLVEPKYILGLAKVLTFGAKKYTANSWKDMPYKDISRYKDALMRHLYAYLGGEYIDPESGQPHIDHMNANLMFLRYFEENHRAH